MDSLIGVEVRGRYDGISHRLDQETGQKYSRVAKLPIAENELCRYGNIYKVKQIDDYTYEIISQRPDTKNPRPVKLCKFCGEPLPKHKSKYHDECYKEVKKIERNVKYGPAVLARRKKTYTKICAYSGVKFQTTNNRVKYAKPEYNKLVGTQRYERVCPYSGIKFITGKKTNIYANQAARQVGMRVETMRKRFERAGRMDEFNAIIDTYIAKWKKKFNI